MVARRPADHALGTIGLVHRSKEVVGAAQLERAGALEALGLEEQATAQLAVDALVLEQRRADRDAFEAAGGSLNVSERSEANSSRNTNQVGKVGKVAHLGGKRAGKPVVRRAGPVYPDRLEAKLRGAMGVPAVRRKEAHLLRRHAAARLDETIDLRIGLEGLDLVDAQHHLEGIGEPDACHHRIEHAGIAVGQDRGAHAGARRAGQHAGRLGERFERQIGAHQLLAHARDRRMRCAARQWSSASPVTCQNGA